MISRGRHADFYLYEITEQDLVLTVLDNSNYAVGNILIFANKKDISLGHELARADDISTAREYLDNGKGLLLENFQSLQETLAAQQSAIEQRDQLLKDLTGDLESQKYSNQLLIVQLSKVREQIEVERLAKAEMVDDLQQVSAETQTLDAQLSQIIDEKLLLEQELAARITDLVELNLQKDDLDRHLKIGYGSKSDAYSSLPAKGNTKNSTDLTGTPGTIELTDSGEVLTMTSGKQIHVYHDFPALGKAPGNWRNILGSSILKFLIFILVVGIIAFAISVVTTSRANGLSLGESLDLILRSFAFS